MGSPHDTVNVSKVSPDARFLLVAMILSNVGTETGGPATVIEMHKAFNKYRAEGALNLKAIQKEQVRLLMEQLHDKDLLEGGVNNFGNGAPYWFGVDTQGIYGRRQDPDRIMFRVNISIVDILRFQGLEDLHRRRLQPMQDRIQEERRRMYLEG
jgi:hypothetical protein